MSQFSKKKRRIIHFSLFCNHFSKKMSMFGKSYLYNPSLRSTNYDNSKSTSLTATGGNNKTLTAQQSIERDRINAQSKFSTMKMSDTTVKSGFINNPLNVTNSQPTFFVDADNATKLIAQNGAPIVSSLSRSYQFDLAVKTNNEPLAVVNANDGGRLRTAQWVQGIDNFNNQQRTRKLPDYPSYELTNTINSQFNIHNL